MKVFRFRSSNGEEQFCTFELKDDKSKFMSALLKTNGTLFIEALEMSREAYDDMYDVEWDELIDEIKNN